MVPDGQKVRMDGCSGRTDNAKTISLRLRRGDKKEAAQARQSLHFSKCHIVGNHMSRFKSFILLFDT